MNIARGSRRVHYWLAICVALPTALVFATGVLLQVKKQVPWVQPREMRGGEGGPVIGFDRILEACRSVPEARVEGWSDVERVDVRPSRGLIKITAKNRYEIQMDATTGEVLQVAYRRSDLIEDLHTGAWFHDAAMLWVFLPNGLLLLGMLLTGLYLFYLPLAVRRRKRRQSAAQPGGGTSAR